MKELICIKHLDELKVWLKINEINSEDVCLVGSAVLAAKQIRENNDLEFAIRPRVWKGLNKLNRVSGLKWHATVAENIDLFKNQFLPIGILDKDIFEKKLFFEYMGFQVIELEVVYQYKKFLHRQKDREDIGRILQYNPIIDSISRNHTNHFAAITYRCANKIIKKLDIWRV